MTAERLRAGIRQEFLSEKYYELNRAHLAVSLEMHARGIANLRAAGDLEPAGQRGMFRSRLNLLKLRYTAGCAVEALRPLYADVLKALGEWNGAHRVHIKAMAIKFDEDLREDGAAFDFEDLDHYQLAIEVVSLGVLLGDGDALRQTAGWMAQYRGTDLLFESLIEPAVSDPRDNTDFFHLRPYDPLIDAFYTVASPDEASAKVKEYLDGWYKSFRGAPWHDGHLHAFDEYMPYYGYWSFEAAAVCVMHGIDDSGFRDHLVYPKDLADWARANRSVDKLKPGG